MKANYHPNLDGPPPASKWYPLFKHMSIEHGLTLLDDEMENIASKVGECRPNTVAGQISNEARAAAADEISAYGDRVSNRRIGEPTRRHAEPMGHYVQQAIDAATQGLREQWKEGLMEGRSPGADPLKCPYAMDSEDAKQWMLGFEAGSKEQESRNEAET